jgi:YbgC/YbaW family acyl-CoA thioester hydrolase
VEFRIRLRHTDCTSRIFFSRYLEFFDDSILEFFRGKGVVLTTTGHTILDSMTRDETFVVGGCSCRFINETFYDDLLEVNPKIEEFLEKTLVFQTTFYNKTRGNVAASGTMTFVYINASTKKAIPIPQDLLVRLGG